MASAIITGADGGIGIEFCRELARRNYSLLLISNRAEPLEKAADNLRSQFPGIDIFTLPVDLTTFDAPARIMQFVKENLREPSILINNAGIFSFAPVCETPDRKLECFIDLHIGATVNLCKTFANFFAERGGGHILNMSSMSCWMPMPGIAMYSATKAFIRTFSRALHYEMRDRGVSVTVACPGGIATDLFGLPDNLMKLALRLGAVAAPDKFAKKAVSRMLKGKQQYINGFTNRLSIFAVGIAPTGVRMQVKRRLLDRGIRR